LPAAERKHVCRTVYLTFETECVLVYGNVCRLFACSSARHSVLANLMRPRAVGQHRRRDYRPKLLRRALKPCKTHKPTAAYTIATFHFITIITVHSSINICVYIYCLTYIIQLHMYSYVEIIRT